MKIQWDVVWSVLRTLLVAGGPVGTLLIALGFPPVQVGTYLAIGLAVIGILSVAVPGLVGALKQTDTGKIAGAATLTPEQTQSALGQVTDADKVLIAKAVPGVATVVVKDTAGDGLAKLAADPAQPDIVTETQNEKDAKEGTKT